MKNCEKYLLALIIIFIATSGIINGVTFIHNANKKERNISQNSLVQSKVLEIITSLNKRDSLTLLIFKNYFVLSNERMDSSLNCLRLIQEKINNNSQELLLKDICKEYRDKKTLNLAVYLQLQELNNQMNIFLNSNTNKNVRFH